MLQVALGGLRGEMTTLRTTMRTATMVEDSLLALQITTTTKTRMTKWSRDLGMENKAQRGRWNKVVARLSKAGKPH
jgi:hypothetical protein